MAKIPDNIKVTLAVKALGLEFPAMTLQDANTLVNEHPDWKTVTVTLTEPVGKLKQWEKTIKDSSLAMASLGKLMASMTDKTIIELLSKTPPAAASSAVLPKEDSEMIFDTRRLSYSSLDLYDSCQYSWLGRYVIGLPDMPSAAMTFGTVVHSTLEYVNNVHIETGELPSMDDVGARFALLWSKSVPDEPSGPLVAALDDFWQGLTFGDLLTAGTVLVRKYVREVAPSYLPVEAEQLYELDLQKLYPMLGLRYLDKFVGRMDMVSVGDLVVDYKTRSSLGNTSWMHLALQPTSYAALLGRPISMHFVELVRGSKGQQVRVFETGRLQEDIDWFCTKYLPSKAKEIDNKLVALAEYFPIEDLPELAKTDPDGLQQIIDKMSQVFTPSPSWKCESCAFRVPCGYQV